MNIETAISVLLIALGAVFANSLARSSLRHLLSRTRNAQIQKRGITLFIDRASSIFFASIAALMIFEKLTIDIRPLLAGVGIIGLFFTVGAQALIKDSVSGFFIFFENLYGEGDQISLDDITGTVEALTLRKTVLRDNQQRLHHIPHGSVKVVSVHAAKRQL